MGLFDFFVLNKNEKLIKRWKGEHHALAQCSIIVQDLHKQGHTAKAKKKLQKMYNLTMKHVQDEDNTFSKMKKNARKTDQHIVDEIDNFQHTFIDVKKALITFLLTYIDEDILLDKKFEDDLENIQHALSDRIKWEERNLYALLDEK